jgi:hypothetical protein
MVFLEIFLFRNMISSGSQHSVGSFGKQTVVKVICSYFQRSQVLDELFPPAHAEPSITSPSDLHQSEVQWWISSFILQTSCLEDVNLRITRFRLWKIKSLEDKVVQILPFVLGGLFCCSLVGHLQTLLYFPFVLDYRTFFPVDFMYYVYPCPVETSRGSILLLWSIYTLFTHCPFETKRGSICLIWFGIVFCWFVIGHILLDKITSL